MLNIIVAQNFNDRAKKSKGVSGEIEWSITDTIQTLISAAHSWNDILGYTIEQIQCFAASIIKLRNLERAQIVWDMFVASQGSHKDVKRYTERLEPVKERGAEDLLRRLIRGNTR